MRRLGAALLGLVQQVETAYEHSASSNKIHPTDFRAICLLGERGTPMSPKEIGRFLGLTSGAVSALVDRLETEGFISRHPNPKDRRSILVRLDENAAAAPLSCYRALHSSYMEVTKNLTCHELEVIAHYLESVREVTDQHTHLAEA